MMYNYWLRNKKIRMARRNASYEEHDYEPYLAIPDSAGHGFRPPSEITHGMVEPNRLVARSNNVFATTSPLASHNDQAEYDDSPDMTNRWLPLTHHNQIQNRFINLTRDYPDEFFSANPEHNPLVLHFRSSADTLPNTLQGNVHTIQQPIEEHRGHRFNMGPLSPEEEHGVKSFIIKELANRAADIAIGRHNTGGRYVPLSVPDEITESRRQDYANALEQLHHEYNNLPEDVRPADLHNYISHRLNATTDPHERHILAELNDAFTPVETNLPAWATPVDNDIPDYNPYNTPPEPLGGEDLDLGSLKNDLFNDLGESGPKVRFNNEGGFENV